ncbi:hypothetical protein H9S71_13540 [Staphylococcus aureus]|uniref:hypothetical protein n=1 Tax=Staphylococcus TaxID=1279 RepID=UPI0011243A81|nr:MULTISPECIES: hypothetical protein [Staphylococcus]MBW5882090.1 hypothetical protein [Staphylococcus aureus]TOZ68160.1 hypothetical protein DJ442_12565 [Staphylococcus pseudintermedius]
MSKIDYKTEVKEAFDYFNEAVMEIVDKEMLEDNIEDLLRFLHTDNFSIQEVLGFYGLSDLQDEYDILRLMEYIEITDSPKSVEGFEKILAENKGKYLIIADVEDDEY